MTFPSTPLSWPTLSFSVRRSKPSVSAYLTSTQSRSINGKLWELSRLATRERSKPSWSIILLYGHAICALSFSLITAMSSTVPSAWLECTARPCLKIINAIWKHYTWRKTKRYTKRAPTSKRRTGSCQKPWPSNCWYKLTQARLLFRPARWQFQLHLKHLNHKQYLLVPLDSLLWNS